MNEWIKHNNNMYIVYIILNIRNKYNMYIYINKYKK